jgi:hypothetical protein
MTKNSDSPYKNIVNRQGASALIAATIGFLNANNISKQLILDSVRQYFEPRKLVGTRQYRKIARAYEEMGIVMSAWFSSPRFLDREWRPLPLTVRPGPRSVHALVRTARVSISSTVAIELMRRSPSIGIDAFGNFQAQRREFVLPNFAVPRAALVIERYLDTLHKNSSLNKKKSVLLLERNCHVPEVNLKTIAPILRDIKRRGSAYIDSVNGDIEELRRTRSRRRGSGELSVHIFAWTRLSKPRKTKTGMAIRPPIRRR